MVVVAKANEATKLNEVSWAWPIQDVLDFLLAHLESFLVDHMGKIECISHAKITLGKISINRLICKYIYHSI